MKTILLAFGAVRLLKEMQMILSRFSRKSHRVGRFQFEFWCDSRFIKGRDDIPRPCYNYITASDTSIGIETKLLKPIPISINSHADTFIPIQKLIAQIFM